MSKFLLGVYCCAMTIIFLAVFVQRSHDVGIDQQVCMEIQNQTVNGTETIKKKCVQGDVLMAWMRTLDGE
jgi:hypothetical protein